MTIIKLTNNDDGKNDDDDDDDLDGDNDEDNIYAALCPTGARGIDDMDDDDKNLCHVSSCVFTAYY